MHACLDDSHLAHDPVVQRVGKAPEQRATDLAPHDREPFRGGLDTSDRCIYGGAELAAKTTPPVLIPTQGQFNVRLCGVAEDDQHASLLEPLPNL